MNLNFLFAVTIFATVSLANSALLREGGCFQSGECRESFLLKGDFVGYEYDCLDSCNSNKNCSWFTYFPDTNFCELFFNCTLIDTQFCPECLSGQRDCVPPEPECWIDGQCEGTVDHVVEEVSSEEECLRICQSTPNCRWFTFRRPSSPCILLSNCVTIDEVENSVSGERRCQVEQTTTTTTTTTTTSTTTMTTTAPPKAMTKLMVANSGYSTYPKSVEIINLDEDSPDLVCNNLPDLPITMVGATGQLFRNIPIICGGNDGIAIDNCQCFSLENGQWISVDSLNECRSYSRSVVMQAQDGQEVLLTTGGLHVPSNYLRSVEYYDGREWNNQTIPDMPVVGWFHCLLKLNETSLLAVGTHGGSAFIYDAIENTWKSGPGLSEPQCCQSCALVEWPNPGTGVNEKVVVLAGGWYKVPLSSVQLLFIDESGNFPSGWVSGPSLPSTAVHATMISYQNSVILIGGENGVDGLKMYQLKSANGNWIQLKQNLKEPRSQHVSFLIPDEFANCS